MRVAGIVVEYNPMHRGHLYHIQQTKLVTNADAVVAVMSGNFLQRGEPAMIDKWTRTKMALRNGVDLVLELPFFYANQSATQFAYGSVATLDKLGIVDSICFGSETGDLTTLQQISDTLLHASTPLQEAFLTANTQGLSFPKAMAIAVSNISSDPRIEDIISKPNNALGIAYLRALRLLTSKIEPYTIQRIHADYHATTAAHESIASATAIRKMLLDNTTVPSLESAAPYIPEATFEGLVHYLDTGKPLITWEHFAQALFIKLDTIPPKELEGFLHMDEGLAYRIHHTAKSVRTVHELIRCTKTKRYTWTRIQRALMAVLIGLTKQQAARINQSVRPDYIRILGFTDIGRQLLKRAKLQARVPLISKIGQSDNEMLQLDLLASRVYQRAFAVDQMNLKQELEQTILYEQAIVSQATVSDTQSRRIVF